MKCSCLSVLLVYATQRTTNCAVLGPWSLNGIKLKFTPTVGNATAWLCLSDNQRNSCRLQGTANNPVSLSLSLSLSLCSTTTIYRHCVMVSWRNSINNNRRRLQKYLMKPSPVRSIATTSTQILSLSAHWMTTLSHSQGSLVDWCLTALHFVWRRSTALTWSRWGCHWLADNMWLLAHDNNNNNNNNGTSSTNRLCRAI